MHCWTHINEDPVSMSRFYFHVSRLFLYLEAISMSRDYFEKRRAIVGHIFIEEAIFLALSNSREEIVGHVLIHINNFQDEKTINSELCLL